MDWLKQIREERGLTQEILTGQIGVAQATYSNIETGARRPSVATAKRIAAVLGFDWTRFFEDGEEPKGA